MQMGLRVLGALLVLQVISHMLFGAIEMISQQIFSFQALGQIFDTDMVRFTAGLTALAVSRTPKTIQMPASE